MRESPGRVSFNNSIRLPTSSRPLLVRPVTFPPGRARLTTSPASTGSLPAIMTIGIVAVPGPPDAALLSQEPGDMLPHLGPPYGRAVICVGSMP